MIIDFHTHVFPDDIADNAVSKLARSAHITPCNDGTLKSLLSAMQKSGVDLSVILPVMTHPKQFRRINEVAAEYNRSYSGRVLSFGGIHPDCDSIEECFRILVDLGFRGIKLHPDYQQVMFNDARYKKIIELACENDMIISVHAGYDLSMGYPAHCSPTMALEILRELNPPKLVLAHCGGFDQWNDVERLLVGQEVYLDLAYTLGFIPEEQLVRIIRHHGADRILFATDNPWQDQANVIRRIQALPIPASDKQKILGDNAEDLLGL